MNKTMYLPCGGEANFDHESGISYRCEMCNAVIGSVGQSKQCRAEMDKWAAYEQADMWRWDYDQGRSREIAK